VLLGTITDPENITLETLQILDPRCFRSFVSVDFASVILSEIKGKKHTTLWDAWNFAIQTIYLDPAGIPAKLMLTWNNETLLDIKNRNTMLKDTDFSYPVRPYVPYPIFGCTILGPLEAAPHISWLKTRNFSRYEFTPLYIGQMFNLDIQYHNKSIYTSVENNSNNVITMRLGGAVEPFAIDPFDDNVVIKRIFTNDSQISEIIDISNSNNTKIDLCFILSASSYVPGLISSFLPHPFPDKFGLTYNYWSPTIINPTYKLTKILLADGGCIENISLLSFLQRKIKKVILIVNSRTPLQPKDKWNVMKDKFGCNKINQIDVDFAAFFGIYSINKNTDHMIDTLSQDLSKNQVFSQKDWYPIIISLQDAQSKGNGIIGNFNLITIENNWWGISAGLHVNLIIVYLGRLWRWDQKLPPEVRKLVVPSGNSNDLSQTINYGTFKGFPHYKTTPASLTSQQANLLADLTGWGILQHRQLFQNFVEN
jgi:hypothetical protein